MTATDNRQGKTAFDLPFLPLALRDAVPWWRTGNEPPTGALVLLCVLTAAAGATAYLLSGRTRSAQPS